MIVFEGEMKEKDLMKELQPVIEQYMKEAESEPPVEMIDRNAVKLLSIAYEAICQMFDGQDVKITADPYDPDTKHGSVEVIGTELQISSPKVLAALIMAGCRIDFFSTPDGLAALEISCITAASMQEGFDPTPKDPPAPSQQFLDSVWVELMQNTEPDDRELCIGTVDYDKVSAFNKCLGEIESLLDTNDGGVMQVLPCIRDCSDECDTDLSAWKIEVWLSIHYCEIESRQILVQAEHFSVRADTEGDRIEIHLVFGGIWK